MKNQGRYAAIWDMDGTLVDTAELHFRAWAELTSQIGKPFSRADFQATFGRRNPEIIRQLFDADATEKIVSELGDRKESLYRSAAKSHGVELLPGARSLLVAIKAMHWQQAIGSSAPRANLDLILELTDTRNEFDVVVSAEDTSRGKPDPQVFLVAAERLGVEPSRCIVFEDAVAGVEAAKAAGMACVAVRFVGHHSVESLRAAGANRIVDRLTEVTTDDLRSLLKA